MDICREVEVAVHELLFDDAYIRNYAYNMIVDYLRNNMLDSHKEFLSEINIDLSTLVDKAEKICVDRHHGLDMETVEECILNLMLNCMPLDKKRDFLRTLKPIFFSTQSATDDFYNGFVESIDTECLDECIELAEYEEAFRDYQMELILSNHNDEEWL